MINTPSNKPLITNSVLSQTKSVYPRRRGIRMLRDALRRWWIIVGFIVASAIQTIGQIFLQSGLDGLNLTGIRNTAVGHLAVEHGTVFWPVVALLFILIPIGWFAEVDHEREQHDLLAQHEIEMREETVEAVLRDQVAQSMALMNAAPLDALYTPSHFVDRAAAQEWLMDRLQGAKSGATFTVEGLGGLGKTSLVSKVLQQARRLNLFPDGTAVVLCENRTDSMAILRAVLKRFSHSSVIDTAEDTDLAGLAQRLLRDRHVLVVFDNLEPELRLGDITGPLQSAGAIILLTARFRIPSELKSDSLRLDRLDPSDAVEVFKEYYGLPLSDADYAAIDLIVSETDYLTLAIVLAAQNAADSDRELSVLASEWSSADAVLDLAEEQPMRSDQPTRGVRRAFEQSYVSLPEEGRRLFQALAVMPTSEVTRDAALAMARGADVKHPEKMLDLLVRRALFEQFANTDGVERVKQHLLLRAFAAEKAEKSISSTAGRAMAEYYQGYLAMNSHPFKSLERDYRNILGGLYWAQQSLATDRDKEEDWASALIAAYFRDLRLYIFLAGHYQDARDILPGASKRLAPWTIRLSKLRWLWTRGFHIVANLITSLQENAT